MLTDLTIQPELLTVVETAQILRLSRTTIWRFCRDGRLKAFRVGHSWRIARHEVEQLFESELRVGVEEKTQPPNSNP